jgi:asparagine N-glycosylation enzyme membrane subunit Stt3
MKKDIFIIASVNVLIFVVCLAWKAISLSNELKATKAELAIAQQEIKSISNEDALSEWDVFTLALMKVESNYDNAAVSSVGAKGYFQIMPIYVEEVNRVHKTNYVYEDVVRSFEKSYEVFTLMQEAHNKDFSMDKALRLHNGNHRWYHRRVYNEMSNIQKYEEMRQRVKNANLTAAI